MAEPVLGGFDQQDYSVMTFLIFGNIMFILLSCQISFPGELLLFNEVGEVSSREAARFASHSQQRSLH